MHIGSEQGQMVFQARKGGDTYLVLSTEDAMLRLYKTEETMLCPSQTAAEEYEDRPYIWSETSGMMSILSEVSRCKIDHVTDQDSAEAVLIGLEAFLHTG